jgi:hypothetical protein
MIDTENKRRSVMPLYSMLTVPPVPDGVIDASDRAHARWIYSGINYSGVVAPSGPPAYVIQFRDTRRR